jgi:hypothetical protein
MMMSSARTIAMGLALAAVPAALLAGEGAANAHDGVSVVVTADLPTFHAALSPYGTWVDRPSGEIWVPSASVVGADFRPYDSGGGWVYTDEGWYFDTAWDWGAIPFHYGRWTFESEYGWVWVAGYDWAPAWVDWSYGGGYVGWAPLPPAGVVVSVSSPHWYYVEERHFAAPRVATHVLPVGRAHYAATVAMPMRTPHSAAGRWYAGPKASAVSRASGRPILAARISAPARGADYRVTIDRRAPGVTGKVSSPAMAPRAPAPVRAHVAPAPGPSRVAPAPGAARFAPSPAPARKVTSPALAPRPSPPVRPAPDRSPARVAPDRAPARVAPGPAPSRLAPGPAPSRPAPVRSDVKGPGPSPRMTAPAPAPRPPPPARSTMSGPAHGPSPAAAPPSPRPRPSPAPAPRPPAGRPAARPGK